MTIYNIMYTMNDTNWSKTDISDDGRVCKNHLPVLLLATQGEKTCISNVRCGEFFSPQVSESPPPWSPHPPPPIVSQDTMTSNHQLLYQATNNRDSVFTGSRFCDYFMRFYNYFTRSCDYFTHFRKHINLRPLKKENNHEILSLFNEIS